MQIPHLSPEAQHNNEILGLQIAPFAVETLVEVGRLSLSGRIEPPELVSVIAYAALGLPQAEIVKAMGYSTDTLQRRVDLLGEMFDVPGTQPAVVRAAFRSRLLSINRGEDTSWPVRTAALSERQGRVMDGVSLGLATGEIAAALGLRKVKSVKGHRDKILNRWHVSSMCLAVTVGHHIGFFEDGQLADDQAPLRPRAMAMSAPN